jgi:ubiquinone biosynthesis monooxygenase Coq7
VKNFCMIHPMRQFSFIDKLLTQADHALTTIFTVSASSRANPAQRLSEKKLTEAERDNSIGCMRVNHTGEVCAQALYRGQAAVSRHSKTRDMLEKSCEEETDHLAWTKKRLDELDGRTSYLNVMWYFNSYLIGVIAGLAGDQWSLGFVEETEIQVAKHLTNHLSLISSADVKSRAIIEKMREEEMAHQHAAHAAGGMTLPAPIKMLMQLHSTVMTTLAYYI